MMRALKFPPFLIRIQTIIKANQISHSTRTLKSQAPKNKGITTGVLRKVHNLSIHPTVIRAGKI
jgi:hypothetical protein